MASKTEICNMAIAHIGSGYAVDNIETERSAEALACRQFYETAKKATLSDFNWPFAKKVEALGLIETNPTVEWGYSYNYPNTAVKIIKILSGIRNEVNSERIAYEINDSDSGKVILTDQADATVSYVKDLTNTALFPPTFVIALSYRLAHFIVPRVSKGDPFKIKGEMWQLYQKSISDAASKSFNEQQTDSKPPGEMQKARL